MLMVCSFHILPIGSLLKLTHMLPPLNAFIYTHMYQKTYVELDTPALNNYTPGLQFKWRTQSLTSFKSSSLFK